MASLSYQRRQAISHYPDYVASRMTALSDAYKSGGSVFKCRAWADIARECESVGGWGLKVISYNSNFFSCGYLYPDPETGVITFRFHTASYAVDVDVPWLNED